MLCTSADASASEVVLDTTKCDSGAAPKVDVPLPKKGKGATNVSAPEEPELETYSLEPYDPHLPLADCPVPSSGVFGPLTSTGHPVTHHPVIQAARLIAVSRLDAFDSDSEPDCPPRPSTPTAAAPSAEAPAAGTPAKLVSAGAALDLSSLLPVTACNSWQPSLASYNEAGAGVDLVGSAAAPSTLAELVGAQSGNGASTEPDTATAEIGESGANATSHGAVVVNLHPVPPVLGEDDVVDPSYAEVPCCVCLGRGQCAQALICDGCDGCYHTFCLDPRLEAIPDDEWYCPVCSVSGLGEGNRWNSDTDEDELSRKGPVIGEPSHEATLRLSISAGINGFVVGDLCSYQRTSTQVLVDAATGRTRTVKTRNAGASSRKRGAAGGRGRKRGGGAGRGGRGRSGGEPAAAEADVAMVPQEAAAAEADVAMVPQEAAAAEADVAMVPQEAAAAEADVAMVPQEAAAAEADVAMVPQEAAAAEADVAVDSGFSNAGKPSVGSMTSPHTHNVIDLTMDSTSEPSPAATLTSASSEASPAATCNSLAEGSPSPAPPPKRGRGRPQKGTAKKPPACATGAPRRGRGRPRKNLPKDSSASSPSSTSSDSSSESESSSESSESSVSTRCRRRRKASAPPAIKDKEIVKKQVTYMVKSNEKNNAKETIYMVTGFFNGGTWVQIAADEGTGASWNVGIGCIAKYSASVSGKSVKKWHPLVKGGPANILRRPPLPYALEALKRELAELPSWDPSLEDRLELSYHPDDCARIEETDGTSTVVRAAADRISDGDAARASEPNTLAGAVPLPGATASNTVTRMQEAAGVVQLMDLLLDPKCRLKWTVVLGTAVGGASIRTMTTAEVASDTVGAGPALLQRFLSLAAAAAPSAPAVKTPGKKPPSDTDDVLGGEMSPKRQALAGEHDIPTAPAPVEDETSVTNCSTFRLPTWQCSDPVTVVDNNHHVLRAVVTAVQQHRIPPAHNRLIHFDSHPDLTTPDLTGLSVKQLYQLFDQSISIDTLIETSEINNWVAVLVLMGIVSDVVWVAPPWAEQIAAGTYKLQYTIDAGGHVWASSDQDVTASYFTSTSSFIPRPAKNPYGKLGTVYDLEEPSLLCVRKWNLHVVKFDDRLTLPRHAHGLIEKVLECGTAPYIFHIDVDVFGTDNPCIPYLWKAVGRNDHLFAAIHHLYTYIGANTDFGKHLKLLHRIMCRAETGHKLWESVYYSLGNVTRKMFQAMKKAVRYIVKAHVEAEMRLIKQEADREKHRAYLKLLNDSKASVDASESALMDLHVASRQCSDDGVSPRLSGPHSASPETDERSPTAAAADVGTTANVEPATGLCNGKDTAAATASVDNIARPACPISGIPSLDQKGVNLNEVTMTAADEAADALFGGDAGDDSTARIRSDYAYDPYPDILPAAVSNGVDLYSQPFEVNLAPDEEPADHLARIHMAASGLGIPCRRTTREDRLKMYREVQNLIDRTFWSAPNQCLVAMSSSDGHTPPGVCAEVTAASVKLCARAMGLPPREQQWSGVLYPSMPRVENLFKS